MQRVGGVEMGEVGWLYQALVAPWILIDPATPLAATVAAAAEDVNAVNWIKMRFMFQSAIYVL